MKGMVFTEFFEMVEDVFGDDVLDDIIDDAALPHDGVYTSVGIYPYSEMTALVSALANRTGNELTALIETFGHHLFGRFTALYPGFFVGVESTYDFLAGIDNHIHVEVKKLYPDAQLPQFDIHRNDQQLELIYNSQRPFGYLAKGLIQGCIEHFKEPITIDKVYISDDMTSARFTLNMTS